MMDWIPVAFVTFKVLVLVPAMFFAIKWHYDQGKKGKVRVRETRAVLIASVKAAAIFVLALLALGLVTIVVLRMLGNDMGFS
jgi:hypothetical protein